MGDWSIDTTVFAPATTISPSGRIVIRITGPETFELIDNVILFDDEKDTESSKYRCRPCRIVVDDDNWLTVNGWAWIFRGPGSYTGQDLIELHIPGSPALMKLVDQRLIDHGLKPAQRGEFTARAVMSGKMQLTQAEAVNALSRAENDAQIQAAVSLLGGKLDREITSLEDDMTVLLGQVEANIDFSEEDIEVISLEQIEQRVDSLLSRTKQIVETAIDSESLDTAPKVFLAGPANAGKSSLVNTLTGLERAICSPVAGTTRDMLRAVWRKGDREIVLVDTAGLLDEITDKISDKALSRVKSLLETADMYIMVVDFSVDPQKQIDLVASWNLPASKCIAVVNKIDLTGYTSQEEFRRLLDGIAGDVIFTSTVSGAGLDELRECVFTSIGSQCLTVSEGTVSLNRRQRATLREFLENLQAVKDDVSSLMSGESQFGFEIVAAGLHRGLQSIYQLSGKDAAENVLDEVFSKFCIGK